MILGFCCIFLFFFKLFYHLLWSKSFIFLFFLLNIVFLFLHFFLFYIVFCSSCFCFFEYFWLGILWNLKKISFCLLGLVIHCWDLRVCMLGFWAI
jgi:hypothetical protein